MREMTPADHILIVEDDQDLCTMVQTYLEDEGFTVSVAASGAEMRHIMLHSKISLVLMDLILPGESGLTLARELRAQSDVGIMILTGRGDTLDRIIGLEMGADDYLPKPFHLRELLARAKSVLRRVSLRAEPPKERLAIMTFNGWRLDMTGRALLAPDGQEVHLTTGEFDLLCTFATNANRILSREELLDFARNRDSGAFDRAIDVQVGRLRRKLEADPIKPALIKTVRGAGYVFTALIETA